MADTIVDFFRNALNSFRHANKLRISQQIVSLGLVVCTALVIWKLLIVLTGSESPVVVVLSGSMRPSFDRGDLLFLTRHIDEENPVLVGDIVVFNIEHKEIPIVHRVIRTHTDEFGQVSVLTKGDNNTQDDRGLYSDGQLWVHSKDIIGRCQGWVPYFGMLTIAMNDYPQFKFIIFAALALFVFLSNE